MFDRIDTVVNYYHYIKLEYVYGMHQKRIKLKICICLYWLCRSRRESKLIPNEPCQFNFQHNLVLIWNFLMQYMLEYSIYSVLLDD